MKSFLVCVALLMSLLFSPVFAGETICSPNDCYRVTRELGEGFFGKVYAVENSRGTSFALKSYKKHADPNISKNLLADAQREFLRGVLLNHPNIIKSFDYFTFDSKSEVSTNIVLQLVNGLPVGAVQRGSLPSHHALKAAIQFVEALRYSLSLDLLHLDLHAGNVMLDADLNAMVIDLASFFSFDEIFGFVAEQTKPVTDKVEEAPAVADATQPQLKLAAKQMRAVAPQKVPEVTPDPELADIEKLKRFFDHNPKLFKQIQKDQAASRLSIKPMAQRLAKGVTMQPSVEPVRQYPDKSPLQYHYFNGISEFCIGFINLSDLSRQEKIELRTEIKKIAWNYEEDMVEGKKMHYELYFEELLQLLYTWQAQAAADSAS